MVTVRHTAVLLASAALALAACGSDDGATTGPSSGSEVGTSTVPPSSTIGYPTSPVALPAAGEPWDLAYVSDSTGFEASGAYADLVAAQLQVPVNLIDLTGGSQSIGSALLRVQAEAAAVSGAEIVVLWGNPLTSLERTDASRCLTAGPAPAEPFAAYTPADFAPFTDDVTAVLDEVWRLRGGAPTVMIVYDLYMARMPELATSGIGDLCRQAWELQSDAVADAATASNASFVSLQDLFNGPAHDQDAMAAGLLASDGIHPSEQGAAVMARAFLATGLDPQDPPTRLSLGS